MIALLTAIAPAVSQIEEMPEVNQLEEMPEIGQLDDSPEVGLPTEPAVILPGPEEEVPDAELALVSSEILSTAAVSADFASMKEADSLMKLASDNLVERGFEALTGDDNFFGIIETSRVMMDDGEIVQQTTTLEVQDYISSDRKDLGALVRVRLETEDGCKEEYIFNLVAPCGDFSKPIEYQAVATSIRDPATGAMSTQLEMVETDSWGSCMLQELKKCASPCVNALVTCPKSSWTAYLGCLAVRCGGCFVAKAACCTCNCKWWCKWAVGCCKR
jgi:hypothetical protein